MYAAFMAIFLLAADGVLYLLTYPIYRYLIEPVADRVSATVNSMGGFPRRVVGFLWQLPRSAWLVLVFSLLLNFYTAFYNNWSSPATRTIPPPTSSFRGTSYSRF